MGQALLLCLGIQGDPISTKEQIGMLRAGGGASSFFLLRMPHCGGCFLETPPGSFGSGLLGWAHPGGLDLQVPAPGTGPGHPGCPSPPPRPRASSLPPPQALAGQPALPDGITSDRAASCLHSPAGRESLAGLEIPAGRGKGQFAGLPFSPTWPRGRESDRVMLLPDMGLALHSAQDGQQARLWAQGGRLQLQMGGGWEGDHQGEDPALHCGQNG